MGVLRGALIATYLITYLLVYSILAVFSPGYGVRCVCVVSVITAIKSASIMNNPAVLTYWYEFAYAYLIIIIIIIIIFFFHYIVYFVYEFILNK